MPIDKSWTDLPNRLSEEFTNKLDSFVESCIPFVDTDGKIRCPCKKCSNRYFVYLYVMRRHIVVHGFTKMYIRWIHHGEPIVPRVVLEKDVSPTNNTGVVIQGVMGERMDEDKDLKEENSGTESMNVDDGGNRGSSFKGKGIQSDHLPNYLATLEGMKALFMNPYFQQCMQQCYGLQATIPPDWLQSPEDRFVNPSIDQDKDDDYNEEYNVGDQKETVD